MRIVLCGKAASGKDHLRKRLQSRGFKYGVSYTTRPPRAGEVNGVDYYFISDEEFSRMELEGQWYESVSFNGWRYGTTIEQFTETCNLFIMTPIGVSHIRPKNRRETTVIWLDIDESTRRERLAHRAMPGDSMERRLAADERDFASFTDFDIKITNTDF